MKILARMKKCLNLVINQLSQNIIMNQTNYLLAKGKMKQLVLLKIRWIEAQDGFPFGR